VFGKKVRKGEAKEERREESANPAKGEGE